MDAIAEFCLRAKVSYKVGGRDPRNYRVNFSKIKERLHCEPYVDLQSGGKEIVDAIHSSLLASVETNRNFFGNYLIHIQAQDLSGR